MKITNEMSPVRKCGVTKCAYNADQNCHAKAITVGDGATPGCDTYFDSAPHAHETQQIAGVGACKVSQCKFNKDYECSAESILVDYSGQQIRCMTYSP